MSDEVSLLQHFENCLLTYDLTAHRIEVVAADGSMLLALQPLPDNPGGFSLANEGQWIEVHQPGAVDFHGVYDLYDTNKEFYGQ